MKQLTLLSELLANYNPVDDSLTMEAMDQEIKQAALTLQNEDSLKSIITVLESHPISIKLHLLCLLAAPTQPEIKLALQTIAEETQNPLHLSAALAGLKLSGETLSDELVEKLIALMPTSLDAKKRALAEIQETYDSYNFLLN